MTNVYDGNVRCLRLHSVIHLFHFHLRLLVYAHWIWNDFKIQNRSFWHIRSFPVPSNSDNCLWWYGNTSNSMYYMIMMMMLNRWYTLFLLRNTCFIFLKKWITYNLIHCLFSFHISASLNNLFIWNEQNQFLLDVRLFLFITFVHYSVSYIYYDNFYVYN